MRIDRIDRCIGLLVDHQEEIADALNKDFGSRSVQMSKFTDVSGSIGPLKHAKENLRKWMRVEKRKPTPAILGWFGAKAEVHYQPLGVVGVISPWNFPVNLTFTPLAGVSRRRQPRMIKPSEFTPASSELMARMFKKVFDETRNRRLPRRAASRRGVQPPAVRSSAVHRRDFDRLSRHARGGGESSCRSRSNSAASRR